MCILTLIIPCFSKVSFLYLHPASTEQICMVCLCQTQRVVIAIGYQSDTGFTIKSFGYEIHRICDRLEARSAKEAIYEGMGF